MELLDVELQGKTFEAAVSFCNPPDWNKTCFKIFCAPISQILYKVLFYSNAMCVKEWSPGVLSDWNSGKKRDSFEFSIFGRSRSTQSLHYSKQVNTKQEFFELDYLYMLMVSQWTLNGSVMIHTYVRQDNQPNLSS